MKRLELYYPVKPLYVTQQFGGNKPMYEQFGIDGHNGMDFMAIHGQKVYAAHDGTVVYSGMDGSEGVGVVLRTDEEFTYENGYAYFKTVYWHLINDVQVRVGQKVKAGDLLGYADNTGYSTGDHLHFALKPQAKGENDWTWENKEQSNGYKGAIDPSPYFNNFFAEDSQKVIAIFKSIIQLLMAKLGRTSPTS